MFQSRWLAILSCLPLFVLFLVSSSVTAQTKAALRGRVTDGDTPVAGAIVRVQATEMTAYTDADGSFIIPDVGELEDVLVTAWKDGYYNGGTRIEDETDEPEIVLAPLPAQDNPDYEWVDPAPNPDDDIKNCGDCHADFIFKQWENNGHARSATNPIFFDLYNGTDAEGKTGVQPGYLLDYPHSAGNCSNCHAPAAAVRDYTGVNMNELQGVEKLGVSCDFCHKIRDVKMEENTSVYTGVMHAQLVRPPEGHQMFFGPYDDVPDPDAYAPAVSESIFCAPCHQGSYWGVPIYESYGEWLASPYAEQGVTCQDCHMPPDGVTTNFAPGHGGVERDPATIPTHLQLGSRDSSFLASTVTMTTTATKQQDALQVAVAIKNVGAGHHMPTDQPMRNLVLLVQAKDAAGNALPYLGKKTIPVWGGQGDPREGNYAGLPGKGFAKVLFEPNPIYVSARIGVKGQHLFPAPQWRIVEIKEDTRIPALVTDTSTYPFDYTSAQWPVTVEALLVYRLTFKNWANMKKWDFPDVVLAKETLTIPEDQASRLSLHNK